jgi:toxin CcdB
VAQFDIYRLRSRADLVIDCQSDLLEHLNTRFVAPLVPRELAPQPAQRLNPIFRIEDSEYVMVTQFAAAIADRELGPVVTSIRNRSFEVIGALDILLSGV